MQPTVIPQNDLPATCSVLLALLHRLRTPLVFGTFPAPVMRRPWINASLSAAFARVPITDDPPSAIPKLEWLVIL